MNWPCYPSRSFHCENCFTLDARAEGPPPDHVATNSGERNQGDGEDLGRHQAYGKGPADVEGACCCPTCHLGVKGMSEPRIARASRCAHNTVKQATFQKTTFRAGQLS